MRLFRRSDETQVIDLRDPGPVESSHPRWGSPVPCPECKSRGYLDHIDPFKQIMYLHCTQCGAKYELTKLELESVVA